MNLRISLLPFAVLPLVRTLFIILTLMSCIPNEGRAQTTPAVIPGDFADPTVIRTQKGYYAAGTSSEWAPHFPVYHSKDLKTWTQVGHIFDKAPEWTAGSFWAPEYYRIGNTFYLYYTARRKTDNISCIGVATSKHPDRGFVDHGIVIAYGKEAIDAFIVKDKGQLYITFKAYGLDKRPIEILADKLSEDGLKAKGEVISLFRDDARIGLEGQAILKKGDYYYLFYSAGNCCGSDCSYHVKVARAKKFEGPYEKYEVKEYLESAGDFKCTGHGTFVDTPGGKTFYLSHAYNERSDAFTGRQGLLSELSWPDPKGWPVLKPVKFRTPLPALHADFTKKTKGVYWQYDFRNSIPTVKQGAGRLELTGKLLQNNSTGVFYGIRTVVDNFAITTTISRPNSALQSLSFYGAVDAATGIGVMNNKVLAWQARKGSFEWIDSATIEGDRPIELKMVMLPGKIAKVFYKEKNGVWKTFGKTGTINIDFLPQWDRAPRVGLLFRGRETESAIFTSFTMDFPLE